MDVPHRRVRRILPIAPRATRMINRARTRLLHDLRQQELVDIPRREGRLQPVLRILVAVVVILQVVTLLDLVVFIVACPDSEGGVVAQTTDVLAGFGRDLREEGRVRWVAGAGEGEVLEDEDA